MSAGPGPLLAIGVGNVLLGDDAVGVRVIEALRDGAGAPTPALPPDARLVDGGTLGIDLVRHLDGVRGLVIVDAADRGDPPGRVVVRRGEDALAAATDDAGPRGVGELFAVARLLGVLPPQVSVVEVAVREISMGSGLSPEVEAAVPAAAEATRGELAVMDERSAADDAGGGQRVEPAGATA